MIRREPFGRFDIARVAGRNAFALEPHHGGGAGDQAIVGTVPESDQNFAALDDVFADALILQIAFVSLARDGGDRVSADERKLDYIRGFAE